MMADARKRKFDGLALDQGGEKKIKVERSEYTSYRVSYKLLSLTLDSTVT